MKKHIILKISIITFLIILSAVVGSAGKIDLIDSEGNVLKSWETDGSSDHIEIQQALSTAAGNPGYTVYLHADTYDIGKTLSIGRNILTGDKEACLRLTDNANWGHQVPMFRQLTVSKNIIGRIEIHGFEIDMNFEGNKNQDPKHPRGKGYNNIFNFVYDDVEIYDMYLHDARGDGLIIRNSDFVSFHDNIVIDLGHEGVFAKGCTNLHFFNNYVKTMTNSACRLMNCNDAYLYNNEVFTIFGPDAGGPGFQIQYFKPDGGVSSNHIEVFNNYVHDTYGPGIWLIASGNYDKKDASGVRIYNNIFEKCGTQPVYRWVAGIDISGFDETVIENNVFDGNYHAGVIYMVPPEFPGLKHDSPEDGEYNTIVRNNVFQNHIQRKNQPSGTGYAIIDYHPKDHTFEMSGNKFYNNYAGNYKNVDAGDGDEELSTAHIFTGDWKIPVPELPHKNWNPEDYAYPFPGGFPYPTDDHNPFDLNDFFDIDYSNTGETGQTENDIPYRLEGSADGRITGGIKIVGLGDVAYIKGKPYIKGEDSILVKHIAMITPIDMWWNGGVSSFDKEVKKEIKDGVAYANLTITMQWYTVSENKLTGIKKKRYHNSTATYSDSKPVYDIYVPPERVNVTVDIYDSKVGKKYSLVTVENVLQQRNEFYYGGKSAVNNLLIGERQTEPDYTVSTNFHELDLWAGEISRYGRSAYIDGVIDPNKLDVKVFSIYGDEIPVKIKVNEHEWSGGGLNPDKVFLTFKALFLLYILWMLYKVHA